MRLELAILLLLIASVFGILGLTASAQKAPGITGGGGATFSLTVRYRGGPTKTFSCSTTGASVLCIE